MMVVPHTCRNETPHTSGLVMQVNLQLVNFILHATKKELCVRPPN